MPHLTLEDLARIVDDGASDYETQHLAACDACRAGLDEMREDVQALGMLPDMAVAPDAWPALEQRLTAEGLIRTRARVFATPWYMHAAAAAVLFLAGTMAGRLTAGPSTAQYAGDDVPAGAPAEPASYQAPSALAADRGSAALATAPAGSDNDSAGATGAEPGYDVVPPGAVDDDGLARPAPSQNGRQRPVTFASNTRPVQPRTVEEAADLLRQTEAEYLTALTRYAELAMQSGAGDPVARLAALQSIVLTTQAALSQAPADPVINGYHLNALAQRDAALRQVATTSGDRWY